MAKKTLILTNSDIRRLVDMPQALKVVEKAFAYHGKNLAHMPPKIYVHLDKYGGDFRAMPAYIEGMEACGIKWVNVYPKNRRFGLPSVMATIILNDPKNGRPLCIMDGTYITNLRTGAAGGIAAKYLARKDSSVVGMVGCGVQAGTQLSALRELFEIKSVRVWGADKTLAANFAKNIRRPGTDVTVAKSIEDCVSGTDIVVTTTPSRRPIVRDEWIKDGTHINAIGADARGKEELEPAILKRAKVVVDDWLQASHSGEINVPYAKGIISRKNIYGTLGRILTNDKKGRTSARDITVFDSTGLAVQDIAVANLVYKKAVGKNIGRRVDILR